MGKRYQEAVFEKSKTKGPQRLLLTILAFHANDETGLCFPGHDTLTQETNMGESTVKRVLTQLKETGEVLVSNKRGRGRGNRYIITLGLSEAEVWAMIDDYRKKSITFETLYWEKRLKSVSETRHYNEESVSILEEKSIESETLKPKSVSVLDEKSLRTETSMLTKVTKRKKELKGELKDPPAISAKSNPNGQSSLSKPLAVHIFRSVVERFPHKATWKTIDQTVGDKQDDLEFWKKVVSAWILVGWNPQNVNGMLDHFKDKRLPKTGKPEITNGQSPAEVTPDLAETLKRMEQEIGT